jgi:hypothetical protein
MLLGQAAASGAITGVQAYQEAKAAETNLNPKDYQQNPNFSDAAVAAVIESGALPGNWSNPGGACAGQSAPKLNLFSTVSGLALGTTEAGVGILSAAHVGIFASAAAAGIATAAIAGVGAIVAIVGMIFAHHAAAVRQEDQIYCAALPAAANAFAVIQQGVQSGQITPDQASAALDALLANFQQAIAPSYGHHPFCNALCEQKLVLDAYVRYWKGQYAVMAAQQAAAAAQATQNPLAPVQNVAQSLATSTGLPTWALWLIGAWLVYEFI